MKQKPKIILTALACVFILGLLGISPVNAQPSNLDVKFEQSPLFSEANFAPGGSVSRWIEVTNNSAASQNIAVEAININDLDALGSQFALIIKEADNVRYNGTLAGFFASGEATLSNLSAGAATRYDFTAILNQAADNPYQGKKISFDILIGFQGTLQGTVALSGGGGGGGLPPGLTIQAEVAAEVKENSVTILWTTNYSATSQVIYATEGEKHVLDLTDNAGIPPKYGYANTTPEYDVNPKVTDHKVTISGLDTNTTYYYRTVSHASLAIGREYSFTTLGEKIEEKAEEKIVLTGETASGGEETLVIPGRTGGGNEMSGDIMREEGGMEEAEREQVVSGKVEGPNPFLANISSSLTFGTGNNIVGIITLFVIGLFAYLAYYYFPRKYFVNFLRKYFAKKKNKL